MRGRVFVKGFVTALPPYCRPQREAFEWLAAAHARAAATESQREDSLARWRDRIDRLIQRYRCAEEHIGWRRSEVPDYMHTDWERMLIFNLRESPRGRGINARNTFYADTVNRVVEKLFAEDVDAPSDLIHVSCTGYVSPSAIQRLIELKHWNDRTRAAQVYHMGCYAALPALRIAAGLLRDCGNMRPKAEIVHTELCTLHFNPGDHSPEQLIVQTLFADGHIRYSLVLGEETEFRGAGDAFELLAVREEIVPGSLDDMTWVLSDWGFRMTLSREVPGKIAACLPRFLSTLFDCAGISYPQNAQDAIFAIHPGGPRILDSLEELLGLAKRQLELSRAVLFERGNMSSATLPHIWMAAGSGSAVKSGTLVVSLAFGPGMTIAGALFRKC